MSSRTLTWSAAERSVLRTLRRPEDVQLFADELPYNKEDSGEKTLRAISRPIDLSRVDAKDWERAEEDLWDVSEWIGRHAVRPLVTPSQARKLRRVEPVAFAQGLLPGQKHPPRERIQG